MGLNIHSSGLLARVKVPPTTLSLLDEEVLTRGCRHPQKYRKPCQKPFQFLGPFASRFLSQRSSSFTVTVLIAESVKLSNSEAAKEKGVLGRPPPNAQVTEAARS